MQSCASMHSRSRIEIQNSAHMKTRGSSTGENARLMLAPINKDTTECIKHVKRNGQ
jgi:hypothetical protein